MDKNSLSYQISRLYQDLKKLLKLHFELLKVELVEIFVSVYSKIISIFVSIVFLSLFLLFGFIALSLYLGELWGHLYLGFLATSGGIFLILLIFLIFKNSLITNPLLKVLISILFNHQQYGSKKKITRNK